MKSYIYRDNNAKPPKFLFQCVAQRISEADNLFEKTMGLNPIKNPQIGCQVFETTVTTWEWLRFIHLSCRFQTREGSKVGLASNSELKRWIEQSALRINGAIVKWNDELSFPIETATLFTKHNRISLL